MPKTRPALFVAALAPLVVFLACGSTSTAEPCAAPAPGCYACPGSPPNAAVCSAGTWSCPPAGPCAGSAGEGGEEDASRGGDASTCSEPTAANSIDDAGTGCQAAPSFSVCTQWPDGGKTCEDLCQATEYYAYCIVHQTADAAVGVYPPIPVPDPSLNCHLAGTAQPPNAQQYCCPCGS